MRGPCLFKESDVKRAMRAVIAAGLDVASVQIDKTGSIVVIPVKCVQTEKDRSDAELNEWDSTG
jgi:hypothetical protein